MKMSDKCFTRANWRIFALLHDRGRRHACVRVASSGIRRVNISPLSTAIAAKVEERVSLDDGVQLLGALVSQDGGALPELGSDVFRTAVDISDQLVLLAGQHIPLHILSLVEHVGGI
jgi:hypothetical protein